MIYGTLERLPSSQSCTLLKKYHQRGTLKSIFPAQKSAYWSSENVFLAQQHAGHLPVNRQNDKPVKHQETGCVITFWGRIDNQDELIKTLKLQSKQQSDAELVMTAWLYWRRDVAQYLVGDFTFCIYDPQNQSIFCARDHLGVRPFYYQLQNQHFVFASSLLVLQQSACCDLSIEEHWLAESLMGTSMSFDKTPYKNIVKLPPGHTLYVDKKTSALQQYYQMSPECSLILKDSREYVEAYQEVLEESIRCRLDQADTIGPLGTELSGGIDSSTITAYAANMLPQPASQLHGFAYAQCEHEPEYIHAVSRVTPMAATHVMGVGSTRPSKDSVDPLNVLGYPEEHSNGSGHNSIYQLANKLNVRTLLSGFGGDEFVTTYSRHTLTELYNNKEYIKLLDYCQGDFVAMRMLRFMVVTLRQWRGAQTSRINPRFLKGCQIRWDSRILEDNYLEDYSLKSRVFDEARYDAGFTSVNEFTINARWKPFVPTRMENCILMAATHNIEYRWPLLDVRLINLFLSIPATEKFYRGNTRWLHRRAIDSQVPKKVTWKMGKDMGKAIIPKDVTNSKSNTPIQYKDLHPMLEAIVCKNRLKQQLSENSNNDISQHFKRQGIQRLETLNRWLSEAEKPRSHSSNE